MLNTQAFGAQIKGYGYNFFAGVPCSYLKDFINYCINSSRYITAANEGDAVAICAGAYLGGVKSVVLMQNSGLTNAFSPLSSLNYIFKIPVLGLVSLRGEEGTEDEPQHELMGKITTTTLDNLQIHWDFLASDPATAAAQLEKANRYIERGASFFFVVRKKTFEKVDLIAPTLAERYQGRTVDSQKADAAPKRLDVLRSIIAFEDRNTVFFGTTGYTGRELAEIADLPNNFYMVGSMGCVGSLGLGLAMVNPGKKVIAIDGDGALLMRMGSLATNGYYRPANLLHIMLDNGAYESTGRQTTVSGNIKFHQIAAACGYQNSFCVHDLAELETAIGAWKKEQGLTFIHLKITPGTKENLGRPKVKPVEVKERFMNFLAVTAEGQ
ncbi:MAG TPA: phosphonopyruvate decarboxylase [Bacillota bacterium]|nr:phosphonopyruvate decarboxylase [Bacillota bacterium]